MVYIPNYSPNLMVTLNQHWRFNWHSILSVYTKATANIYDHSQLTPNIDAQCLSDTQCWWSTLNLDGKYLNLSVNTINWKFFLYLREVLWFYPNKNNGILLQDAISSYDEPIQQLLRKWMNDVLNILILIYINMLTS